MALAKNRHLNSYCDTSSGFTRVELAEKISQTGAKLPPPKPIRQRTSIRVLAFQHIIQYLRSGKRPNFFDYERVFNLFVVSPGGKFARMCRDQAVRKVRFTLWFSETRIVLRSLGLPTS